MMMGVRTPARRSSRQTSKPSLPGSITSSRIRSNDARARAATAASPSRHELDVVAFESQIVFEAQRNARFVFDDQDPGHTTLSGRTHCSGRRTVNVLPRPTSLDSLTSPRCASTISFDHRQADAGALDARLLRPLTANELVENARLLLGRNADALVAHATAPPRSVVRRFNPDGRRIGRILDGVLEQVPNHPAQRLAIGIDDERRRIEASSMPWPLLLDSRRYSSMPSRTSAEKSTGSRWYSTTARVHASEVEQVLHQPMQSRRLFLQHVEVLPPPSFVLDAPVCQQFGELAERGQRSPEFMRHGGDEVGLQARGGRLAKDAARHRITGRADQQHDTAEGGGEIHPPRGEQALVRPLVRLFQRQTPGEYRRRQDARRPLMRGPKLCTADRCAMLVEQRDSKRPLASVRTRVEAEVTD